LVRSPRNRSRYEGEWPRSLVIGFSEPEALPFAYRLKTD